MIFSMKNRSMVKALLKKFLKRNYLRMMINPKITLNDQKKKKETWQTSDFKETQRKHIFAKKSTIDLLKRKRKKKILNGGAKPAFNGAAASKLKSSTLRSRPGPKPKVRPQEPPLDDEASSDG